MVKDLISVPHIGGYLMLLHV